MHITCIVITLFFAFLSVEGAPQRSIKAPKPVHTSVKAIPSVLAVPQSTATAIPCSKVGDPTVDPATRWQQAGADLALAKAVSYYNNQSSLTFSRAVSHYFNGPEDYDCQLIDSPCTAGVSQCESVTSSAGWLILNSLSNFHNLWNNVNTALQNAEADITPQLGTFTSTFAPPVKDDTTMTKELFDIFSILLSMFNAEVGFAAGFVKTEAKPDMLGKAIDKGTASMVGILSGTLTIQKDLLPAAQQQEINEEQLGTALSTVTNTLQEIYSDMAKDLMENGAFHNASPVISAQDLLSDGVWVSSSLSIIDNRELKLDFEHALYGLLVQRAWKLTAELYPTVVITNQTCDDDAKYGWNYIYVPKARSCAIPGVTIYVLGVKDLPGGERIIFVPDYLPGGDTDTLTGDSGTWGGLTIDDIAVSAYNGFIANGNQPGYQMPNTANIIQDGQINTDPWPLRDGVRTPGFFNIPTCTSDTMYSMLDTKDSSYNNRGPNWPCQP